MLIPLPTSSVQCNGWSSGGVVGSAPAPLVGTVAAGATVTFNWTEWPVSHKGPIITYLARAPSDVDVTQWEPETRQVHGVHLAGT